MHLLWRFEICLPSLYIVIEFSPNDQNTPKLFLSIKRTNIYISSNKYVLNRSLPMEVRSNTFPLSWWCDSILNNFFKNFLCREVSRCRHSYTCNMRTSIEMLSPDPHPSGTCQESFICLKIAIVFNSFCSNLSVEVCSLIPSLEMSCLSVKPPH
jgi:hypothetical protein